MALIRVATVKRFTRYVSGVPDKIKIQAIGGHF
jgi:hypothetical protein